MGDILAVVGSTAFEGDTHAKRVASDFIINYYRLHKPDFVISGGADGIDRLAVAIADVMFIGNDEYLPKNYRWEPEGFKDRNIQIADACTRLLCIRHYAAKTYGSGWTADYAETIGKPVQRVVYNSVYQIETI